MEKRFEVVTYNIQRQLAKLEDLDGAGGEPGESAGDPGGWRQSRKKETPPFRRRGPILLSEDLSIASPVRDKEYAPIDREIGKPGRCETGQNKLLVH